MAVQWFFTEVSNSYGYTEYRYECNEFFRYGKWLPGPSLQVPRHGAAAVELFGRMYVFGGIGFDGGYLDTSEVLEPNENV